MVLNLRKNIDEFCISDEAVFILHSYINVQSNCIWLTKSQECTCEKISNVTKISV